MYISSWHAKDSPLVLHCLSREDNCAQDKQALRSNVSASCDSDSELTLLAPFVVSGVLLFLSPAMCSGS